MGRPVLSTRMNFVQEESRSSMTAVSVHPVVCVCVCVCVCVRVCVCVCVCVRVCV